jgi:hypothetical protein
VVRQHNPNFFVNVIASSYNNIKIPPATTTEKRLLLSTNTGPKSRRKKMNNISPAEDHALCKAYVNVNSDTLLGTGQKAMQFAGKVKTVFENLLSCVDDDVEERDQEAMMHRFKRNIQKHVNW